MTTPTLTVCRRLVHDCYRSLAWWTFGLVALVLFTVAFFPSIRGQDSFDRMISELPEAMRSLFSLEQGAPLTSAPGYLQGRFFSALGPVTLLVFAIGIGARATAGSEEDGTLELLLATPITRTQVMIGRFTAMVVMLVVLGVVVTVSLLGLGAPFGALEDVSLSGLIAACAAAAALALFHGAMAFAVGTATGRRAPSIAVPSVVAITGFLVHGLAGLTDAVQPLRAISPWQWFLADNMLVSGPSVAALTVPVSLSLALAALGIVAFNRRDLT